LDVFWGNRRIFLKNFLAGYGEAQGSELFRLWRGMRCCGWSGESGSVHCWEVFRQKIFIGCGVRAAGDRWARIWGVLFRCGSHWLACFGVGGPFAKWGRNSSRGDAETRRNRDSDSSLRLSARFCLFFLGVEGIRRSGAGDRSEEAAVLVFGFVGGKTGAELNSGVFGDFI